MSLSELMSNMVHTAMPQIALVMFLVIFVAVVVDIFRRKSADVNHAARLPLDDMPSSGDSSRQL